MKMKYRLMALFVSVIAILLQSASSMKAALPAPDTNGIFFAVSADDRSPDYSAFATSMAAATDSAQPASAFQHFLPLGSLVSVRDSALVRENDIMAGHMVIAAVNLSRNVPFVTDMVLITMSTPSFYDQHLLRDTVFSPELFGVKWGPQGKDGPGKTYYTSGNANGVEINQLVGVVGGLAYYVYADQTVNDVLSSVAQLNGGTRFQMSFEAGVGGYSSLQTVDLTTLNVPEPSSAVIGLSAGALLWMGIRRKK